MKLLLDTHLLLWVAEDSEKLPPAARRLVEDPGSELWFSVVSLWEVAIKAALNRPGFRIDPRVLRRELLDNMFVELPVTADHVLAVAGMAPLHRDPFDRLLIAQAATEGVTLVTKDAAVARYPGSIISV